MRRREVLAAEDIADIPVPPSHRHPMSGEPVWDTSAVREIIKKLKEQYEHDRS